MSRIPNCRENEYYNEKYLNQENKAEVKGYDWCAEEVVDNFFDNLDSFFDVDSYLMHVLSQELPESMHEEYEVEYTFGDKRKENRQVKTYMDLLRSAMLEWVESERNELIVSMIDNMDNDEYEEIKKKVDGE